MKVLFFLAILYLPYGHQLPMKRHAYEHEHVHLHSEVTSENAKFFKMIYFEIVGLLKHEEFAMNLNASAVIKDVQIRMKEKSMDILNVTRNTDMEEARDILEDYKNLGEYELHEKYDIVKTEETTEKLFQLEIDTNIYLVQNLIKALELSRTELGISLDEMNIVKSAVPFYYQDETYVKEATVAVEEVPRVDRVDKEPVTTVEKAPATPEEDEKPVNSTIKDPEPIAKEPSPETTAKPSPSKTIPSINTTIPSVTTTKPRKGGSARLSLPVAVMMLMSLLHVALFY